MRSSYRHIFWRSLVCMSIGQFLSIANFILAVLQITQQYSASVTSAGSIGRQCRLFFIARQHPTRSLLQGGTVRYRVARCAAALPRGYRGLVLQYTWHWVATNAGPAAACARRTKQPGRVGSIVQRTWPLWNVWLGTRVMGLLLWFSQKLDLSASASVASLLLHWFRGWFMRLKRMLRIQFL